MNQNRVSYDGNDEESYSLLLDGNVVGVISTGEDGAREIVRKCNSFINARPELTPTVKNDDDQLGVIVDIYEGDDWVDGITLWFEDFID